MHPQSTPELLCSMFQPFWLREHFRDWYPRELRNLLHDRMTPIETARTIVETLREKGRFDKDFFDRLRHEVPGRKADIDRIERMELDPADMDPIERPERPEFNPKGVAAQQHPGVPAQGAEPPNQDPVVYVDHISGVDFRIRVGALSAQRTVSLPDPANFQNVNLLVAGEDVMEWGLPPKRGHAPEFRVRQLCRSLEDWGRAAYAVIAAETGRSGLSLQRPRLRIGATDSVVLSWPWELLRPENDANYLAIKPGLERYLPNGNYQARPVQGSGRVLLVVGRSFDDGIAPDHLSKHLLQVPGLTVKVLVGATLDDIAEELEQGYHLLHLDTHGRWQGGGELLLGPAGKECWVSATNLAINLQNVRTGIPSVVLTACSSARTGLEDPFSAVATTLLQAQVPWVVGSRFVLEADCAAAFVKGFYGPYSAKAGIHTCMQRARLRMLNNGWKARWDAQGKPIYKDPAAISVDLPTWLNPVLYTQLPGGQAAV